MTDVPREPLYVATDTLAHIPLISLAAKQAQTTEEFRALVAARLSGAVTLIDENTAQDHSNSQRVLSVKLDEGRVDIFKRKKTANSTDDARSTLELPIEDAQISPEEILENQMRQLQNTMKQLEEIFDAQISEDERGSLRRPLYTLLKQLSDTLDAIKETQDDQTPEIQACYSAKIKNECISEKAFSLFKKVCVILNQSRVPYGIHEQVLFIIRAGSKSLK
ncbi:MAG: hypothetical protein OEY44_02885 [Candidatus Peregrinibacteria bacterium]|nr:hypothetical protein [Candidatus Peregrinibacteria bacterium]